MAYDYGSQNIEITNPFKFEGIVTAIRGFILAVLGAILIFSVKDQITSSNTISGWIQMIGGIVLLTAGVTALSRGLLKLFKFYVGRNMPANLAEGKQGKHRNHKVLYSLDELKDMLMSRSNLTFVEPKEWLARLLHTMVPNLLFLPMPMRNIAQKLFEAAAMTIVMLVLYALVLFSGSTGLTTITESPVGDFLGWLFVIGILVGWVFFQPTKKHLNVKILIETNKYYLPFLIAGSIVVPSIIVLVNSKTTLITLLTIPVSPYPWLFALLVMSVIACGYGVFMSMLRIPQQDAATDASEFRDHWQESVNPMDIYRAFDMTMADYRFIEIPNRVYEKHNPQLINNVKGSFSGSTVQEVQPIPVVEDDTFILGLGKKAGVIVGQALMLMAGIWLYVLSSKGINVEIADHFNGVMGILLFTLFGLIINWIAHTYYSEITFESHLIHFFADGTFNKSKMSTGMSINDSTRSENDVVQSSITPWFLGAKVVSSTFATSGTNNLEQYRYIIEMHKDDNFLNSVASDVKRFIDDRQIIADVTSQSDLKVTGQIHQINDATRAQVLNVPPEQMISQDVRKERLTSSDSDETN